MVATPVLVGMAEIQLIQGGGVLSCIGLGSCIGLLFTDLQANVHGMVHVMLPKSFEGKPVDKIGKFADTGVPELLRLMEEKGASKSRIKVAYAGGASVFKFGAGTNNTMEIGARNADAVAAELQKMGLRTAASDVGGNQGRTVNFDSTTGIYTVRTVTGGERPLCTLR